MLNIFLARHGQNEDNANGVLNGHRDLPLTPLGVSQAHELADNIVKAGITFDAVYASPLVRARKTAEVVCETLGLPVPQVLDLLIERDFGFMTGELISDIPRLCAPNILFADPITYFIGGEGVELFPDLYARAVRALDFVRSQHVAGSILLAGHGDMGKMIYGAYHRIGWRDSLTAFHFGNCELVRLSGGGDPRVPDIVRVEQHNH